MCDKDFFFNENVGGCFPCSDICDFKGTGNSKAYCKKICPEYNPVSSPTLETNTNYLEIILPAVIIVLVAFIIIGIILVRKRRRRKRNVPPIDNTPAKPLKWTVEEKGDELEKQRLSDSGIDTHRVENECDDSPQTNTFQETPQTGLSELHCNSRYLKNASDASGAQALIA